MAPPISSAIAMMPAIATTAASSTRMTTSSTGLPFSITISSTSHSTQISLDSALSTTAITPTAEPTPKSDGKMKKLGIGLGVGLGVVALALLLGGIYKYHRRREGRERYHQALTRAHLDAHNTANRAYPRSRTENPAHGERGVGSSAESAKTESIPMRGHMLASSEAANRRVQTLATSEAVPTIVRALTSPGAVNTRVQTLATSETVPTIARTLATSEAGLTRAHTLGSSEGDTGSRPASRLPTALPNSPIEPEELATDSPADAEPTPELGPDTSGSDTSDSDTSESEQQNATPLQPTTSTRSKTATPAQMDGTSSPSPDTDMMTRVPTVEGGLKSHSEPAQDEATAPAKPAESLQVEGEVERQWSWQQGDDEHLQRSLEARVGLDEQVQHVQESPEEVMESEQ